jgi:hypothetical protein
VRSSLLEALPLGKIMRVLQIAPQIGIMAGGQH